jgi:hypothetical protein
LITHTPLLCNKLSLPTMTLGETRVFRVFCLSMMIPSKYATMLIFLTLSAKG